MRLNNYHFYEIFTSLDNFLVLVSAIFQVSFIPGFSIDINFPNTQSKKNRFEFLAMPLLNPRQVGQKIMYYTQGGGTLNFRVGAR